MNLFAMYFVVAGALTPVWTLLVPLYLWTRWIADRAAVPRFAVRAAYTLLAVGGALALCAAVGGARAVAGVTAGESVDPSQKARLLGEGISEAMNGGALVFVVAALLAAWLLFGTWRWHWAVRAKKSGEA